MVIVFWCLVYIYIYAQIYMHIYTIYKRNIFDGFSDESSTLILLFFPTSTRNTWKALAFVLPIEFIAKR